MNFDFQESVPFLPCACASLRRVTRAVSRMYNRELRSTELEITQFTLLMALDLTGETSQGELGRLLALDSTTLTRMLELLRKRTWITLRQGDDRRRRMVRLTQAGSKKLQESRPYWKRAQDNLRTALGEKTLGQFGELLEEVMRRFVSK